MPVRNGERFLRPALDSLVRQTWRPLEIIVVDDGSTDASTEIAASFGDPVRTVRHAAGSPVLARNHGIGLARGAFLCFLDQDDLSIPARLALKMAAFAAEPALDVCVGTVQRIGQRSTLERIVPLGPPKPGYLTIAMLARREAFARVGLLSPAHSFSDAAEWFLRARSAGLKVRLVPEALTYHRDHEENLSLVRGDQARSEFLRLIKAKLDRERRRA